MPTVEFEFALGQSVYYICTDTIDRDCECCGQPLEPEHGKWFTPDHGGTVAALQYNDDGNAYRIEFRDRLLWATVAAEEVVFADKQAADAEADRRNAKEATTDADATS